MSSSKEPLLPPEKLSFFQIFIKKASPSEKKIIILICLIFGMSGSMILGIPIVFKDPKLICLPENIECSEETACSQDFFVDLNTGPNSFSADFSLICDKTPEKTFAITLNFVGVFVGCLMSTFMLIRPKNRQFYLSLLGLLQGLSLLGMLLFQNSFFIISLLICFNTFCFMYVNTFSYLFIGENLKGELAGFTTIMYSVSWAITGIFFAIFAIFIQSNWRIFVFLTGIISILAGIGLFCVKSDKNYKENEEVSEENIGLFSYFHDMWPNVQIRKNFIVYAIFWSLFTMVYSAILIELESVGGNVYINMCFCSSLEILAAILAGNLTKKYSCTKTIRYLLTFLSIFFTIFLFSPTNLTKGSLFETLFFIVCLLLGKVNNDTLNLVTYLNLPKAFTDKYVGFWLLCSRFLCRFLGLFIPMISFLMRSLGIHPFCFYGFCWILCRIIFNFTKEMQTEGVDDLLNEANVNMIERISVIAGSFSNGILLHDDNLKNIHFEGIPLSVFRKYKQDPESFKGSLHGKKINEIMKSFKKISGLKRSEIEMKETEKEESKDLERKD